MNKFKTAFFILGFIVLMQTGGLKTGGQKTGGLSAQQIPGIRPNDLFSTIDRLFNDAETRATPADEYFIGRAVAANILSSNRPYTANPELTRYLNMICRALAINSRRPLPFNGYHVAILDSPQFNAFATPGGHIFLTRGLVEAAPSEDALAGIIAHELAHIMLGHGMKMIEDMKIFEEIDLMARQAAAFSSNAPQQLSTFRESVNEYFFVLARDGYSVPQEFEADALAVELMAQAGYFPGGLLEMLYVLQRVQRNQAGGFNSTHPSPTERISNVQRTITLLRAPDTSSVRRERFNRYMGRR